MRALVQCVSRASVSIEGKTTAAIERGFLVFLGIGADDTEEEARRLWDKIWKLRVFEDAGGKTNLSLSQVEGELLVVSQFTLYADCRKGNRPSFTRSMEPRGARALYERFIELAEERLGHVEHGEFGAMMDVSLVNHGPFTVWLDTDEL